LASRKREVSAAVSWLASPMRSEPTKRFSLKIWLKLKVAASVSKVGKRLWSRYGVFT
jgi:hypothetical protein